MIFVIILPYLGVLVYLIARASTGMADRNVKQAEASAGSRSTTYVRVGRVVSRPGRADRQGEERCSTAATISQAEFDALKAEGTRLAAPVAEGDSGRISASQCTTAAAVEATSATASARFARA